MEGGGGRLEERRRQGKRTDQVGVIRLQFVVQFGGVRFVDGVPERHPASDNGLYVFWVGSPGTGHRREVGVDARASEPIAHLRDSARRLALTSSSSAPVSPARAPITCTCPKKKGKKEKERNVEDSPHEHEGVEWDYTHEVRQQRRYSLVQLRA